MIEIDGVSKRFGHNEVLRDVSLAVERGEVLCLIGPSGSGKSTLLRCVAGLEEPDSGTVTVCGQSPSRPTKGLVRRMVERGAEAEQPRVGVIFQQFNLFPHMTALRNVTVGPVHVLGERTADAHARAFELLSRVGLSDKAASFPSELSGGQQQRVAIARALAMQPMAMLFDEATSALDPELKGEVLSVMRELADGGMTMIVVTHELEFARRAADRIAFMDGGQILEYARPSEIFSHPRHERTQAFLRAVMSPMDETDYGRITS